MLEELDSDEAKNLAETMKAMKGGDGNKDKFTMDALKAMIDEVDARLLQSDDDDDDHACCSNFGWCAKRRILIAVFRFGTVFTFVCRGANLSLSP
mmetsp:Transcript_25613/g.41318  ORF Transcript_25613/g.41318 Transcript_25613/m.41318 type:complete len:95 (+) Transcript_25613:1775-2059(+)